MFMLSKMEHVCIVFIVIICMYCVWLEVNSMLYSLYSMLCMKSEREQPFMKIKIISSTLEYWFHYYEIYGGS